MASSLLARARLRWGERGGYRELLAMALPLILSTSAWSIQHFVDRMFLTWYSAEAVAAAMPAGLVNFAFSTVFVGTAQPGGIPDDCPSPRSPPSVLYLKSHVW